MFNKKSFEGLFDDSFSEDELSDNYEEFDKDDDEDKEISDKIVDKALSNEQMSHINGEFAPYFNNVTEMLMFY